MNNLFFKPIASTNWCKMMYSAVNAGNSGYVLAEFSSLHIDPIEYLDAYRHLIHGLNWGGELNRGNIFKVMNDITFNVSHYIKELK